MSALLLALGIGIVIYVAFALLFPKAIPEEGGDYMRQALDRIYEENRQAQDEQITIMRDALREEPPLIRMIFGLRIMQPLYEAGLQAGYQQSLDKLLIVLFGMFVAVLAALFVLGLGIASIAAAPVGAYFITLNHCQGRVRKRNRKFIDQFPDALDMIVRSVRSGFPLSVALQMLAENAENPVKAEFRQVVDEIALGRSLQQALGRLSSRINEPDIRFFVVVLSVQQETGGNLAEIISNLSNVIRRRKQLRHKIHAMTSEGRTTGWVLGMLPVGVFIILYVFQRDYLSALWLDSLGRILFGIALSLIGICFIVVRQMINVDI
ncbi:MAG: type II secretion system F family protein [Alphaproteobacteria bacterium]